MASMVFSKFGASGFDAMASISSKLSSMAFSMAGFTSATCILSKAGVPIYGPVHGLRSLF